MVFSDVLTSGVLNGPDLPPIEFSQVTSNLSCLKTNNTQEFSLVTYILSVFFLSNSVLKLSEVKHKNSEK